MMETVIIIRIYVQLCTNITTFFLLNISEQICDKKNYRWNIFDSKNTAYLVAC